VSRAFFLPPNPLKKIRTSSKGGTGEKITNHKNQKPNPMMPPLTRLINLPIFQFWGYHIATADAADDVQI